MLVGWFSPPENEGKPFSLKTRFPGDSYVFMVYFLIALIILIPAECKKWLRYWLPPWWNEEVDKSSPQKVTRKLEKNTVKHIHFNSLKIDQKPATNREACVHESN